MIIAITGYKGSGKDTIADYIADVCNFGHVNFADSLREAMRIINPVVGSIVSDISVVSAVSGQRKETVVDFVRYNDAVETYGYTDAKNIFPEIRRILQVFATDWARNQVDYNFWINLWMENFNPYSDYVISDLRFENEEIFLRSLVDKNIDVYIIRVIRTGYNGDDHESEKSIARIQQDHIIYNTSDIDSMLKQVDVFLSGIGAI
jgi:hypothetical protein